MALLRAPGNVLSGLRGNGQRETDSDLSDLQLLSERGVRLLAVHSEADEGLDYLPLVLGKRLDAWSESGFMKIEIIKGANHVFTMTWSQDELLEVIGDWATEI